MKLKKQLQYLMAVVFALMLVAPAMAQLKSPPQQKNGVYNMLDDQPSFPGGNKNLFKYLAQNVKYPKADLENNVQGKAVIQFVVEKDGSLTEVKVVRAPTSAMGKEAKRVFKNSPKWKPGKVKGKAVRTMYTMPVNFTLEA